jgi:hypothetical protein
MTLGSSFVSCLLAMRARGAGRVPTLAVALASLAGCGSSSSPTSPGSDGGGGAAADVVVAIDGDSDAGPGDASTRQDGSPAAFVDVSGTVFDALDGLPASGATVLVLGGSPVKTDAAGQFAVLHVPAPYSVAVAGVGGSTGVALYVGLTRADPLLAGGGREVADRVVSASFSRSQGGLLGDAGAYASFGGAWPGLGNVASFATATGGGTIQWYGPQPTSGTLALFETAPSGCREPLAFATAAVADAAPDASVGALDLAMQSVTASPTPVTIALPAGWGFNSAAYYTLRTQGGAVTVDSCPNWKSGDPVPVATMAGVTTLFTASAVGPGGQAYLNLPLTAGPGASFTVPAPPDLAMPAQTAWPPPVSWTPHAAGLSVLLFQSSQQTLLTVFTGATTITPPDLSSLGVSVASGTHATVQVATDVDLATVDDAASTSGAWSALRGTLVLGRAVDYVAP